MGTGPFIFQSACQATGSGAQATRAFGARPRRRSPAFGRAKRAGLRALPDTESYWMRQTLEAMLLGAGDQAFLGNAL